MVLLFFFFFFVGLSFVKTPLRPGIVLKKQRKDMSKVRCSHDITEVMLKAELNNIQSIEHSVPSLCFFNFCYSLFCL